MIYLKLVVDNTKRKSYEHIRREQLESIGYWVISFAWFPIKLEDVGWVWLTKYQKFVYDVWSGGICGGYVSCVESKVMFRSNRVK